MSFEPGQRSMGMDKRIGQVIVECIFDLGITVVYATLAGLLIVAVIASDDGPISFLTACLYASLLPGAVIALIGVDLLLRLASARRAARGRVPLRESLDRLHLRPIDQERKTCFR